MLYQLSYFRIYANQIRSLTKEVRIRRCSLEVGRDGFEPPKV